MEAQSVVNESSDLHEVGLIGVGLLGSAIASRLMNSGFQIRGYDTDEKRLEEFGKEGGFVCECVGEVLESCKVLILSLPSSDQVFSLIEQLADSQIKDRMVIDTTTGDPEQMVSFEKTLTNLGASYVEATVAGSSQQVIDGTVALFLGGESIALDFVQPVLTEISSKRFHLGPVGAASKFKLVHNLVLGLHRAVLAEGLAFAESLDFDPMLTLSVLKQTPAVSGVMETKGEQMVSGDYRLQARLSQHLKDVKLILSEVSKVSAYAPLSQIHQDLLEHAEQLGFGEADNSSVIEAYRSPKETGNGKC